MLYCIWIACSLISRYVARFYQRFLLNVQRCFAGFRFTAFAIPVYVRFLLPLLLCILILFWVSGKYGQIALLFFQMGMQRCRDVYKRHIFIRQRFDIYTANGQHFIWFRVSLGFMCGVFVYSCYWKLIFFMSFHLFQNCLDRQLNGHEYWIYYQLDGVIVQFRIYRTLLVDSFHITSISATKWASLPVQCEISQFIRINYYFHCIRIERTHSISVSLSLSHAISLRRNFLDFPMHC